MLFIAVVIEIVTLVGLFITGIMLNSNIRLTEFWSFLLFSQSRTLISKSTARKSVLLILTFSEKNFLKKAFSYT